MRQNDQTFRFGDLRLRLTGELPPHETNSYLWRFAIPGTEADVRCDLVQRDAICPPEGEILLSKLTRRVTETAAAYSIAYFSDSKGERCHALLTLPKATGLPLRLEFLDNTEGNFLSCIAMEHLNLCHRQAVFHSAWFERAGEAVMFTGNSGVGKSTHTNLWAKERGVRVVNGDKSLLLRRGDRFYAAGIPYAGSSGICENRTLPVQMIVFLSHGTENHLRRLPAREAVSALVSQMPVQKWCANDLSAAVQMALSLAERVPVYAYACVPNVSAVDFLEQALFSKENG